jgi:hypothetical protein
LTLAKKVDWHEDAKRDLRGIDRESAMRILHGIARYAKSGEVMLSDYRTSIRPSCVCAWVTIGCGITTMAISSMCCR